MRNWRAPLENLRAARMRGTKSMHVALLGRALDIGGAERQLVALANGLVERGHRVSVLTFYGGGRLRQTLDGRVNAVGLEKSGRYDVVGFQRRLWRALDGLNPSVIYSWLPVANIAAGVYALFRPRSRVVWSLRAGAAEFSTYNWMHGLAHRCEQLCSRLPRRIIANAEAGRADAIARGYPESRVVVVPNGIDTRLFTPDPEAGAKLRDALGIAAAAPVIGHIARFDPMKDHRTLLEAAARLCAVDPEIRILMAGDGDARYAAGLEAKIAELGLAGKVRLLGAREDMPALYNACDIVALSSRFGEGFPNVLGEAMACGVPCIATDIGDARQIIGDTGDIVPIAEADALAAGCRRLLDRRAQQGQALAAACRARIVERFSLDAMVRASEAVLREVSCSG
jgi:glycosyltransferase involved in cell wall biosynthesis